MTAIMFTLSGCDWKLKPTFPANRIASDLERMCAKEYHLVAQARHTGDTLQAFVWKIGVMKSGKAEMKTQAAETLERVLLCMTRISLSTDAPLRFVEVKLGDVLTGATVSLWRYVPDIRDSMATRLAEEEYSNRLVVELNPEGGEGAWRRDQPPWDPPITFDEFLAKQVVLRAKRESPVSLQAHEDLSRPDTLVVVIDNWPAIAKQGSQQKAKVTAVVHKTARKVLEGYRFRGFHGVLLLDAHGAPLGSWKL